MSNFDDLKLAVEMLSGGTNTVIFDDIGMPSVMVSVAKMLRSALVTGGTDEVHPAFMMDGVEQSKAYMSKFQNIVMNSRAYSLPMQDPQVNITFDTALTYCRNKGEGWGIQPGALWSAIALWCKKNGFQPRGNNNYGKDVTNTWENGVVTYTYTESGVVKIGRTATGSGPAGWYHDNTRNGIADMNGNIWEWCAAIRLVAGELQIIPYANCMLATCDMSVNSTEWKAIAADGTLVTPGSTTSTIHLDYVSNHWTWIIGNTFTSQSDSSRSCLFQNITASSDVSDSAKILLRLLTLLPEDSDTDYGSDYFWANNAAAERFLFRGGRWRSGADAGVFLSDFDRARSSSDRNHGFRSAFYGEL